MGKLSREFYEREDVVQIARKLIGKVLCTNMNGQLTSGIIVESEAYNGRTDKACHAYNKRTPRTEVMYGTGGISYVYLCYGIHNLFNVVTNQKDFADAVLIRAIEPLEGVDIMEERRGISKSKVTLTSGPGSMAKALGIDRRHDSMSLFEGNEIWIEDRGFDGFNTEARKRVGVDYADEDALLPWRFVMKDNKWVSKPNF